MGHAAFTARNGSLLLSFTLLAARATGVASAGKKITVCHVPPGAPANAQTISIGEAAVSAHLAHGDGLGVCPAGCSNASACDDGNRCTGDLCDEGAGCLAIPDDGASCSNPPEAKEVSCADHADNDCDGSIDGADPDCFVCGDGVLQPGEECDDGNTNPFDGCDQCIIVDINPG